MRWFRFCLPHRRVTTIYMAAIYVGYCLMRRKNYVIKNGFVYITNNNSFKTYYISCLLIRNFKYFILRFFLISFCNQVN
jgi:hypothetical protein